jgi:Fic family protein
MNKSLNKRQEAILNLLEQGGFFGISEILTYLNTNLQEVTKITVNRDLKGLLSLNYLEKDGQARATTYKLSAHYNLIRPIDIEKYFRTESDKRIVEEKFNFHIFSLLNNIFTESEQKQLETLNEQYKKNIQAISPSLKKQEFERLIIELSWKSSQIEGNTYSLLETEALIKGRQEAKGHKKEEATMILNHKEALDYINKNQEKFLKISPAKIEDIHYLLTNNLGIDKKIRKTAVGIIGTKYRPIDNSHQILEVLEKTCNIVNKENNPFAKAIILSLLIAYIQPFEDGNKRTSRLTANAILLANNICPLSYRNVNEFEYKKAVILFYEKNNLSYFKQLFIEQFKFAVNNYFR